MNWPINIDKSLVELCKTCSGSGLEWFTADGDGNCNKDICSMCDGLGYLPHPELMLEICECGNIAKKEFDGFCSEHCARLVK